MVDGPPPAKRARRDYDLTKTFDVLVGKEPNQQRFTVHHDLLVQRSEFFKAARALRWTQADQPTTLEDHDPETFSTYLHCLYFGVDAIKDRLSLVAEQHGSSNKPTINNNESDKDSSSDSHSDSDSASEEGQNEQLSTEVTTQKPPKTLTVTVDGKEKEAAAILFVGNLSWITEEKALEQAFEEFGELRGVRIVTSSKDGRSKGFGYVEFTSPESAANALQARTGFELDGRGLRLDFAKPRSGTPNTPNQDQQRGEVEEESKPKSHVSGGATDGDTDNVQTNQTGQDEDSTIDYNTNYGEEYDGVDDAGTRVLIKLYVLADKLIDIHTANLVIDAMIAHIDVSEIPDSIFINIVYKCTPSGSPLRALFRDLNIHETPYYWFQEILQRKENLPIDFLNDIILEYGRIHAEHHHEIMDDVLTLDSAERPTGHYHQKAVSSRSNRK